MKKKDASTFIDHLLLTYEKNALEPNDSEGTAA